LITRSLKYIDLHIHSNHSDGSFDPIKIVKIAAERKLAAIAITDHDQVSATFEAQSVQDQYGVEVVPGIELSALLDGYEIHLLGYLFDLHDPAIQQFVKIQKHYREKRAKSIVKRLEKLGIRVPFALVKAKSRNGNYGRPHIADVLVEEGHVFSFAEAFQKYLGDEKPAFVPKLNIHPQRAIKIIKDAGGVTCVAHPALNIDDDLIARLVDLGLDGIEVYHPRHTSSQVEHFSDLAQHFGLLKSGGSDCHGIHDDGGMIGRFPVPVDFLEKMKDRAKNDIFAFERKKEKN